MNDPLVGLGSGRQQQHQHQHQQQPRRSPGGPRNLQESRRPRHVTATGGNGIGYHQHTAGWNQAGSTTSGAGGHVPSSAGGGAGGGGGGAATQASQMRRAKALLDVQQRARARRPANGHLTADDLPFRRPGQGLAPRANTHGQGLAPRANAHGRGLGPGTRTSRPTTRRPSSSSGGNGGIVDGHDSGGGVVRTRPPTSMQGWIRQAKAVAALEKRRSVIRLLTLSLTPSH